MARQRLKLRDLKRILKRYGVDREIGRGKGSHILFFKDFPEGRFTYPMPDRADVLPAYVKGCRKRFRLLPEDGVSDEEFFGA